MRVIIDAPEGYSLLPAEDIEELNAHYEWGVEGEQTVQHLAEALRRIGLVLHSQAWTELS